MAYPKYVRPIGGTALYYDRVIPIRLHSLTPERKIRIPLGLTSDDSVKAIQRAALDSQEEYESRTVLLDSSSPEMLTGDQIDHNIAALLHNIGRDHTQPMNPDFHPARELTEAEKAMTEGTPLEALADQMLKDVDAVPVVK